MVNLRQEEVKIVDFGEAFSCKSIPQINGSQEEAVQIKLPSYQGNTQGMWLVPPVYLV